MEPETESLWSSFTSHAFKHRRRVCDYSWVRMFSGGLNKTFDYLEHRWWMAPKLDTKHSLNILCCVETVHYESGQSCQWIWVESEGKFCRFFFVCFWTVLRFSVPSLHINTSYLETTYYHSVSLRWIGGRTFFFCRFSTKSTGALLWSNVAAGIPDRRQFSPPAPHALRRVLIPV